MRRPSRARLSRLFDIALPWLVGAFLIMAALDEPEHAWPGAPALAVALAVVQGAALRWRRTRPEIATAVVLAAGLGYHLLAPSVVVPVAGMFAVASLAAARPPRVSLLGLAGLEALSAMNFATATVEDTLFVMGFAVGVWALGEAWRSRRVAIEEAARRATGEEQARIARELHDVIAHSVSVIVVQAAAADDVFDDRPDQARAALRSIEHTGREALGELRRLLGAVRPGDGGATAEPQPALARLEELAEPLRAGGLRVVVRHEGSPHPLPAGVELSAYRIVQEALTNTLRHARATRADVLVRYAPDAVELDVSDDGSAPVRDGATGGHGLIGMRERAALLEGTLDAGPAPGGGFRVRARLPLEAAR